MSDPLLSAAPSLHDHPDHRHQVTVLVVDPATGDLGVVQSVRHPGRQVRHEAAAVTGGPDGSWSAAQVLHADAGDPPATSRLEARAEPDGALAIGGSIAELAVDLDVRFEPITPVLDDGFRVLRDRVGRLLVAEERSAQWGRVAGHVRLPDGERRWSWQPATVLHRRGIVPVDEAPTRPVADLPARFWLFATAVVDGAAVAVTLDQGPDGWPLHRSGRWAVHAAPPADTEARHVELTCAPGTRRPVRLVVDLEIRGTGERQLTWEIGAALPGAAVGGLGATWPVGSATATDAVAACCEPPPAPGSLQGAHHLAGATVHLGDHGEPGVGVVELLAVGPHAPSGWADFLDGAG